MKRKNKIEIGVLLFIVMIFVLIIGVAKLETAVNG